MKILFMGTPEIAADSLEALIKANHEICGVFTREDKPVGRKQVLTPPPVKTIANKHGLKIFQPKTLKTDEAEMQIKALMPDVIVVVAYGRILPKNILDMPKYGCVNLHVSLLPKYRGAAPVQWAVINGDEETGVTIMYMDEGIDTGDILKAVKLPVGENETSGELFERVSSIGAKTLCDTLLEIQNGTAERKKQDNAFATPAPILNKAMSEFNFNMPAERLHNLVRGLNPWPTAYFVYENKKIKVLKTLKAANASAKPGELISLNPLVVACIDGALELCEVVPEGSKAMSGAAWAAGKRLCAGKLLT